MSVYLFFLPFYEKNYVYHMLHSDFCPCVGVIGATFAVGACLSARFREKDDYKNAVVGGMLAGLIFGYKSKCPITCVIELIVQALHGLVPPHCRTNISEHKIYTPAESSA